MKKILIFYASYGGGHLSAAKAIKKCIDDTYNNVVTEMIDCVKYINKTLSYVQLFIGRKFDINDTKFMDEIFDIRKKENNDIILYFIILHSMNATDDGTIIYIDDDIKSFLKNSFTIEQYIEQPFYSS